MTHVTFFTDVFARDLTSEELTHEELAERIRTTSAPTKAALPLLKLARFGSLRTPPPENCLRHDANVQAISGAIGDYDQEQMPAQEAHDRLEAADIFAIVHSSPSHRPNAPRFRVIAPTSKELPPSAHTLLVSRINAVVGGTLARESWVLSQSYHHGGINGPPAELYIGTSERTVDEADELGAGQPYQQPSGGPGPSTKKTKPDYGTLSEAELLELIKTAAHYFGPASELARRWAYQGIPAPDAEANLITAFDTVPQAQQDRKWAKARARVPKWVKTAYAHVAKQRGTYFRGLMTYLTDDDQFRGAIRLNTFSLQIEVSDPYPLPVGATPSTFRALRDPVDILETMVLAQENGFPKAGKETITSAVVLVAEHHPYHPVRDYLESLQWDGEARAHRLFIDYFPGERPDPPETPPPANELSRRDQVTAYYENVGKCFLDGCVARVFQPGVKLDTLPVLIGLQGDDKSKTLQALVPDPAWFSDDLSTNVVDRDAKESLTGKWIIELSEFPHIRKEVERIKAFFSRQVDRYRRAYGRLNTDHPRQCAFCATANEIEFIDMTGNRRFWPVPLAGPAKVTDIIRDRDQLWAEAMHLYRSGLEWWLSPSLEAIARMMQDSFVEDDVLDELITEWLEQNCITRDAQGKIEKHEPFAMREMLKGLVRRSDPAILSIYDPVAPDRVDRALEMRAARRLKRLGYRQDPHRPRTAGGRSRLWIPTR